MVSLSLLVIGPGFELTPDKLTPFLASVRAWPSSPGRESFEKLVVFRAWKPLKTRSNRVFAGAGLAISPLYLGVSVSCKHLANGRRGGKCG